MASVTRRYRIVQNLGKLTFRDAFYRCTLTDEIPIVQLHLFRSMSDKNDWYRIKEDALILDESVFYRKYTSALVLYFVQGHTYTRIVVNEEGEMTIPFLDGKTDVYEAVSKIFDYTSLAEIDGSLRYSVTFQLPFPLDPIVFHDILTTDKKLNNKIYVTDNLLRKHVRIGTRGDEDWLSVKYASQNRYLIVANVPETRRAEIEQLLQLIAKQYKSAYTKVSKVYNEFFPKRTQVLPVVVKTAKILDKAEKCEPGRRPLVFDTHEEASEHITETFNVTVPYDPGYEMEYNGKYYACKPNNAGIARFRDMDWPGLTVNNIPCCFKVNQQKKVENKGMARGEVNEIRALNQGQRGRLLPLINDFLAYTTQSNFYRIGTMFKTLSQLRNEIPTPNVLVFTSDAQNIKIEIQVRELNERTEPVLLAFKNKNSETYDIIIKRGVKNIVTPLPGLFDVTYEDTLTIT